MNPNRAPSKTASCWKKTRTVCWKGWSSPPMPSGLPRVIVYVRGEYPYAYQVMSWAIEEARQAGYLGENILGSGFDFEIELRRGAGAYICGEETALFESIEGKRGFPAHQAALPHHPWPVRQADRHQQRRDAVQCAVYPRTRRPGLPPASAPRNPPAPSCSASPAMSPDPGCTKCPSASPCATCCYDLAGGVRGGRKLQAILFGGAAGAFATPDQLDVRLTFEDLRAAGLPLGSGVVMVFDETRDLRDVLLAWRASLPTNRAASAIPARWARSASTKSCSASRPGKPLPGDAERLADVGWTMTDASLCGLGQTAATAVLSALKLWPDLFNGSKPILTNPIHARSNHYMELDLYE